MAKKRIYALARRYNLSSKRVIELLAAADIDVRSYMSLVYEDEAEPILRRACGPEPTTPASMRIVRKKPAASDSRPDDAEEA